MTEKYSPQKHEFGTDAAAEYAKSITPGQGKKEKKRMKEFFEYIDMLEELQEGAAYRKRYSNSSGNIRLNTSASQRSGIGASVSLRSSNSSGLGWNYNTKSGKMTIALRGTGIRYDFGGKGKGKTGKTQAEISRGAAEKRKAKASAKLDREVERDRRETEEANNALEKTFFQSKDSVAGQILNKSKEYLTIDQRQEILDDANDSISKGLKEIRRSMTKAKSMYDSIPKESFMIKAKTSLAATKVGWKHGYTEIYEDLKDWSHDQFELIFVRADTLKPDVREGRNRTEIHLEAKWSPVSSDGKNFWEELQISLYDSSVIWTLEEIVNNLDEGVSPADWYEENKGTPEGTLIADLARGNRAENFFRKKVGEPITGSFSDQPLNFSSELMQLIQMFTGSSFVNANSESAIGEYGKETTFQNVIDAIESTLFDVVRYHRMTEALMPTIEDPKKLSKLNLDYGRLTNIMKQLEKDLATANRLAPVGESELLYRGPYPEVTYKHASLRKRVKARNNYLKRLRKMHPENIKGLYVKKMGSADKRSSIVKKADDLLNNDRMKAYDKIQKDNDSYNRTPEQKAAEKELEEFKKSPNVKKIQTGISNLKYNMNSLRTYVDSDPSLEGKSRFRRYEKRGLLSALKKMQKHVDNLEKEFNSRVEQKSAAADKDLSDKSLKYHIKKIEKINKMISPAALNKAKKKGKIGSLSIIMIGMVGSAFLLPTSSAVAAGWIASWIASVASPMMKKMLKKKDISSSELEKVMKEMYEEYERELLSEDFFSMRSRLGERS